MKIGKILVDYVTQVMLANSRRFWWTFYIEMAILGKNFNKILTGDVLFCSRKNMGNIKQ